MAGVASFRLLDTPGLGTVAYNGLGARRNHTNMAEEYALAHPARAIRDGRDTWLATSSPEPRSPAVRVNF
jgi:hypothetical protein